MHCVNYYTVCLQFSLYSYLKPLNMIIPTSLYCSTYNMLSVNII